MKTIKELQEELALAKKDEAYHRKQMEYQKEQIEIIETQIVSQLNDDKNKLLKEKLGKYVKETKDSNTTTVKCQVCGKNDVTIMKNQPYFGIVCSECSKKNTVISSK